MTFSSLRIEQPPRSTRSIPRSRPPGRASRYGLAVMSWEALELRRRTCEGGVGGRLAGKIGKRRGTRYPESEQYQTRHFDKDSSAMFCPLPLHAAEFRSDDVDEVHGFVARFDGNHRRAALEAGPLGYQVRMVRCGEVDAGWGITHTRQRISGVPRDAILHIPTGRRHIYATRGRTFEGRPDTAVLLAPGQEDTLLSEPRDAVVVLRLPGARAVARGRKPQCWWNRADARDSSVPGAPGDIGGTLPRHR